MEKIKKNISKGIIAAVIVICAVAFGLYGAGKIYFSETKNFERRWNIAIPETAQNIYTDKFNIGFQGNGARCSVYTLDKGNALLNDFRNDKNKDVEEMAHNIIDMINVPAENQPDFSSEYIWTQLDNNGSTLLMIYNLGTSRLFLIESII